MAVNPMQRKSRNSFLLGMLVTLLISSVIIILLFLQLKEKEEKLQAEIGAKRLVYTLNQDVKSGQILTEDMFSKKSINIAEIPSDATSLFEVIESWFLQTKDGYMVNRDKVGLYLNSKPDSIIEVYEVTKADIEENNTLESGGYYRIENGQKVAITLRGEPYTDADGLFVIDTNDADTTTRIYEEVTEGFYCYKLDPATNYKSRVKVEVNMTNVPILAKVNMNANTVLTRELIVQSDSVVTKDVRKQEYNMIVLPTDLLTDDYVDIRLMLPSGQNFIVIPKKQITVPQNEDGTYIVDTIWMNLREDEILALSSAIVEAYGVKGAKLYANKYVEPGMQEAATPTYVPNASVTAQLDQNGDGKIDNPNIVEQAMSELAARYSENAKNVRNQYLQNEINNEQSYDSNVETKMESEITSTQSTRKKYLDSLNY